MQNTKKMKIGILFPHQLFEQSPVLTNCNAVFLVEEDLFFKQYDFHKQKLVFHRSSMKQYNDYLLTLNIQVNYIESGSQLSDIRNLIPYLKSKGFSQIEYTDTTDNWLEKRLHESAALHKIILLRHPTPLFLNTSESIQSYFSGKNRMFQTEFYKQQRKSRNILIDSLKQPTGGKWTFDDENRQRYPKGKKTPHTEFCNSNSYYEEACQYVNLKFKNNPGIINADFILPSNFIESKNWLKNFLQTRFESFGNYEDAILDKESILHHSILSPMLNTGLIRPDYIIEKTLHFAEQNSIPLNSLEGFIRQVMGWREFIRAVYECKGSYARNRNYWGFTRKIPAEFWNGTTGILPVDNCIRKVLNTGYCHHIERLMVLGNFMLLCEFDPKEVYEWFMALFIDSYDWVMVPNVYGMSQFADGGIMATKPYISGSNYLIKMSNYPKGEWTEIWDSLFWRFMYVHQNFFVKNPRSAMLIKSIDKMPEGKMDKHLTSANAFLSQW
jgi:deoxyribodipyrimidine photolyase-related protein